MNPPPPRGMYESCILGQRVSCRNAQPVMDECAARMDGKALAVETLQAELRLRRVLRPRRCKESRATDVPDSREGGVYVIP